MLRNKDVFYEFCFQFILDRNCLANESHKVKVFRERDISINNLSAQQYFSFEFLITPQMLPGRNQQGGTRHIQVKPMEPVSLVFYISTYLSTF